MAAVKCVIDLMTSKNFGSLNLKRAYDAAVATTGVRVPDTVMKIAVNEALTEAAATQDWPRFAHILNHRCSTECVGTFQLSTDTAMDVQLTSITGVDTDRSPLPPRSSLT